jgi:hypothetical protein
MKTSQDNNPIHQPLNIMEQLVHEEIAKQVRALKPAVKEYINPVEVATYALNRLPPLYACSQRGKTHQTLLATGKYQEQIKIAVNQGIAAVQRDPLRVSQPLLSELGQKYLQAQAALQELEKLLEARNLLDYQQLSWANLVAVVQRALNKALWTNTDSSYE